MAGPGRPRKHLQDEHHFQTSDDPATEGAPPVAAESDQAGVSTPAGEFDAPAELEAVVEESATASDVEPTAMEVIENAPLIYQESPAEEKIHQLVDEVQSTDGWHNIDTAPRGGLTVRVSENTYVEGVDAFFKRTRVFSGKKWEQVGKFVDHQTGLDLPFQPKYWRERF